ncbi:DNA-3-methyladenine glycosylase I [Raineyella sp. W15-4]|uniref:DNA-3-methyladenine glycosylase I n=1 Tax=Raineyella sp. W15-4 TaxID=3081651 RepID=UPI002954D8CC|nr:DNA-3-methyladenine glycosylase I [Raineyella sp. W15-4]WOQ16063.1 DNA-3-methyladenine glycosylase I [Raineyella sp. W15-4]
MATTPDGGPAPAGLSPDPLSPEPVASPDMASPDMASPDMASPAPVSPDLVVGEDGLARPVWAAADPLLREYYDTEWGVPIRDERGMFEKLSLEAFQSGLSWLTILRKRPAFRAAFDGFVPDRVADYTEADVARLLTDPGIVRNRRKIEATIANARATVALRERGGLVELVWSFRPADTPAPRTLAEAPTRSAESEALARALRREGFVFVGPTTMYALMESVGVVDTHLVGSHRRGSSGVWS